MWRHYSFDKYVFCARHPGTIFWVKSRPTGFRGSAKACSEEGVALACECSSFWN